MSLARPISPADSAPAPMHWQFDACQVWLRAHAARTRGEPGARQVLANALAQPPDTLPIQRDQRGKPFFEPHFSPQAINWSHSAQVLLVAMGPVHRLGVDVERQRERPRLLELAGRFFHPSELDWLHAQPPATRNDAFVRLWCLKEAVLKAHGHGVSFGLDRLVFAQRGTGLHMIQCDPALGSPTQWHLYEWQPLPGYRAALAWQS